MTRRRPIWISAAALIPGASYRVTIHSGDWTRTGGGSGL